MFDAAVLNKLVKLATIDEGKLICSIEIRSKTNEFQNLKNQKIKEIEGDNCTYQIVYGDPK